MLIAAALSWSEFLQQIVLTLLPVLTGWLGHKLGFQAANGYTAGAIPQKVATLDAPGR